MQILTSYGIFNLHRCRICKEWPTTVDAVGHARRRADEMVTHQGVALAVSLDITNAFNSIPWNKIMETLRYHQVP
jgi:hypothetical protein